MGKLYRSSRDKKLFGICGGLAESVGVDANLLRILLVILAFFSGGAIIPVYIIAGFIIPREPFYGPPHGHAGPSGHSYGGWNGSGAGYTPPQYGTQSWPPGQSWPPQQGTPYSGQSGSAGAAPTPAASAPQTQTPHQRPAQGLDAMMEDIEKKAMRKELEELRAKITKLEQNSKGE